MIKMILGFYGNSNSGKTTLIRSIITELKKENLKVAVIKHIHHKNFSIDDAAKDTGKFKNDGVDVVALSPNETAFVFEGMELDEVVFKLQQMNDYEVILIEGLKKADIPKIRVGNCEIENNTIMSVSVDAYKNTEDLKNIESQKIVKLIKSGLKKEKMDSEKTWEKFDGNGTEEVIVIVNGKKLPIGNFPKKIVKEVVFALISSLKGGEKPEEIEIKIKKY